MAKQQDPKAKQTLSKNIKSSSSVSISPFKQASNPKTVNTITKTLSPLKSTKTTSKMVVNKPKAKSPIMLKEVVVSAPKKKAYTSRDSTAVGYAGKYKNVADKDLKQLVKNKQMSSIDTTSKGSMSKTAYGKDPNMVADLVKRNKSKK